jgi:hypothetical protein
MIILDIKMGDTSVISEDCMKNALEKINPLFNNHLSNIRKDQSYVYVDFDKPDVWPDDGYAQGVFAGYFLSQGAYIT